MKKATFTGKCVRFWAKPLSELAQKEGSTPAPSTGLPYGGDFEQYENISEVRSANDTPSDDEVVKFRNAQRKANAKQKAMAKAVVDAGYIQPTIENDDQLRLEKMFELFHSNIPAATRTSNPDAARAQARELASNALGIKWADEDED